MSEKIREDPLEESAPLFSSWTHWYILVLSVLAGLIILFTLFTKAYD